MADIEINNISGVDQSVLDSLNVEQQRHDNKETLDKLGGVNALAKLLSVDMKTGLTNEQVKANHKRYGDNTFPESPMLSFIALLIMALSDTTLCILMFAAAVSLGIGVWLSPDDGWIEGSAIFIAVLVVSLITAGNDYSKQFQFRALEASSARDERTSVFREGTIERINPKELTVGDIVVLQAGDMIPADSILLESPVTVKANESSLTGEPDDLKKNSSDDCFLLSSCTITEGEEVRALVIGIGTHSQWGKIKANLIAESVNTPLQDKLEDMTATIGYVGMIFAAMTFIVLIISIWARDDGNNVIFSFISAFILAVTVVVVAIPEGLPLAVTIALAYSTTAMYQDQCFIRVLAACETMGNATNICSDKTGTLTENRMTVVEGWFADEIVNQDDFAAMKLSPDVEKTIVEQISINRSAYMVYKDAEGKPLHAPQCIGNKTEGALIVMQKNWGADYETVKNEVFDDKKDKIFSFNSGKKRSTAVVHRPDGSVRVYCKGASEWILRDCAFFSNKVGDALPMDNNKRAFLDNAIADMARNALRTLCLAHVDFKKESDLPEGWEDQPPDDANLVLDCIVGIIDPLREDVKEAVRLAQQAGVTVRMVTGDNVLTAQAIARQCGILTADGLSVEGPTFRKMTPKDVDAILPRLQVMARSSPDDKYLLVTRLNGHGVPDGQQEWEAKMKDRVGVTWDKCKDLLMPGYRQEWEETRPEGGDVVGVTGDGTNDAPALKAADVGLAMGITGTKVAQGAADIVILDDKFSSIVRAITWGRAIYDNIRKFVQFQLTVNVVALFLVFIGACAGFGAPLNAVQLLWVNLVMDSMGALALATEGPHLGLLNRKPYKRSAKLISRPMIRNIGVQSTFQIILLLSLLFQGPAWFGIRSGVTCERYATKDRDLLWDPLTLKQTTDTNLGTIDCRDYKTYCASKGIDCVEETRDLPVGGGGTVRASLADLDDFEDQCLTCNLNGYTHGSIIFNAFIWCQLFNEYTMRNLFDEVNPFEGVWDSKITMFVSVFSACVQYLLIEFGGEFVKTSHLTASQWLITIALGFIGIPLGMMMRYIPVKEDPSDFFEASQQTAKGESEGSTLEDKIMPVKSVEEPDAV